MVIKTLGVGESTLLLHGFTGCGDDWRFLGECGHKLLLPDLPGHGRTGVLPHLADYAMPQVAAALVKWLAARGDSPFDLVGYSMGGRLALYLALYYPTHVRSLVLESASPGLASAEARTERMAKDEALADFIESAGIPAFVARWEKLGLWDSQKGVLAEKRAALHAQRLQNNPAGLADSLRAMGTGHQPNLWPRLSELTMPVLLLAGELDHKFKAIAIQMAAALPQAQMAVIRAAGHTLHFERPHLFKQSLLNFWASF